ncbi:hypothetical protein MtrunA17_Chr7g0273441 [Medicago truncatula]|uniref:Uncharacterized protein n=1 Tax=Medicago truncatula TaxID=3880 RepID=A0A396H7V2_MEDTR|nr:hypothetical protein MtrunA17_Chr7g0273441 [Medicago truncatula]
MIQNCPKHMMRVFCLPGGGGPLSGKKRFRVSNFKICQHDHTPFVIISCPENSITYQQDVHNFLYLQEDVSHLKCSYNDPHPQILKHNHLYDLSTLE